MAELYLGDAQFLSLVSNHLASPCQVTRFEAEKNHGGDGRGSQAPKCGEGRAPFQRCLRLKVTASEPVDLSRATALLRLRMVNKESFRRAGIGNRFAQGAKGFGMAVERSPVGGALRQGTRSWLDDPNGADISTRI